MEPRTQTRIWRRSLVGSGLFVGLGWWLYVLSGHKAARGECPLASGLVLILLVLWWWWPDPQILFERETPFRSGPLAEVSMKPLRRIKVRLTWTTASIIGWVVFEFRATDAAHLAAARQTVVLPSKLDSQGLVF
jgi:hypothetical protein